MDQTGAAVPGAQIRIAAAGSAVEVCRTESTHEGAFVCRQLPQGQYVVLVSKPGFRDSSRTVQIAAGQETHLPLRLALGQAHTTVTVTAVRGEVQEVFNSVESVSMVGRQDLGSRAYLILPQALQETAGIHLQQTSTSQGSPFVRGLTGQYVLALIDGARFNNATFRPGANQYTALIDPLLLDHVEILHGTGSTQYGSDALGGVINVLSPELTTSSGRHQFFGRMSGSFSSADNAPGAAARFGGSFGKIAFLAQATGRHAGDLRTGQGIDSHSVVTRLLGLPSSVLGDHLAQSGYDQYGGLGKLAYQFSAKDTISATYMRGKQLGANRYDQLNGGNGNLLHEFDPQVLDFFTLRYNRLGLGFLDSLSGGFSINRQRDDRRYQNINNSRLGLRSNITLENNLNTAFGYQGQATTHIGARNVIAFGAETYREHIESRRRDLVFQNATGGYTGTNVVRARFPDGAHYNTFGIFAQESATIIPNRLTATAGVRYSRFGYNQTPDGNPLAANGTPTVPAFSTTFADTTFHVGGLLRVAGPVNITGRISRGFRAPNVNDLASIGISGIGFEVSAEEGERLSGRAAPLDPRTASAQPVRPLKPEQLYSYELGVKVRQARWSASITAFDSEFTNFIERRTVLLPSGAVGTLIGGQPITRQDASGAVYVSVASAAVFVRANGGDVRFRGGEAEFAADITRKIAFTANASLVRATDLKTNLPPSIENGVPPATGFASLRWQPSERYWVEACTIWADAQRRLSDNDMQQARIGGIRTRTEITDFFNNGAVARGLVSNGILVPTGETLNQVLRRVLGANLNAKVPMFYSNPGYAAFSLRGGYRLGERTRINMMLENLFDKNFRTMGSGVDAPGRSFWVRYVVDF